MFPCCSRETPGSEKKSWKMKRGGKVRSSESAWRPNICSADRTCLQIYFSGSHLLPKGAKGLLDAQATDILEEQWRENEIFHFVWQASRISLLKNRCSRGRLLWRGHNSFSKLSKDSRVKHIIICKWYLTWYHLSWPEQQRLLWAPC